MFTIDKQTDKHIYWQTNIKIDRRSNEQIGNRKIVSLQVDKYAVKQVDKQTGNKLNRKINKTANRLVNWQVDRQLDRKTGRKVDEFADRQTKRSN